MQACHTKYNILLLEEDDKTMNCNSVTATEVTTTPMSSKITKLADNSKAGMYDIYISLLTCLLL